MNTRGQHNRLLVRTTWKKSFSFAKFNIETIWAVSLLRHDWSWEDDIDLESEGKFVRKQRILQIICNHKILFISVYDCLYYTIISQDKKENRIMNNHELFWKLTGDWGQEKTFWLVPHSARCDWLMRPRPSINQIQTLKCDPYNFSEHALSSVWKRRGTSIVRFSFQVILFNSVKLLLFAI